MKNFIIFFVLTLAVTFYSCKKDSKTPVSPNAWIVGKWNYTADTIKEYNDGVLESVDSTGSIDFSKPAYYLFNNHSTGNQVFASYTWTLTYSISGNILTIKRPAQTLNGLSIMAASKQLIIVSHNNNSMNLYWDDFYGPDYTGRVIEASYFIRSN
jgi:hypothetical protein